MYKTWKQINRKLEKKSIKFKHQTLTKLEKKLEEMDTIYITFTFVM